MFARVERGVVFHFAPMGSKINLFALCQTVDW